MSEDIEYVDYTDESMLPSIQSLVSKDLSEPYSVFTYRYFLHDWPNLCICVYTKDAQGERKEMIGTLLCRGGTDREPSKGYIAMLAVNKAFRKRGIGSTLASMGIERMAKMGLTEVGLEAEVCNTLDLFIVLNFMIIF